MNGLVTITDQKAVTTSLIVAEAFEKQHKDVLRSISRLECSEEFNRRNFAPVGYTDAKGEVRPACQITRDGFAFLAFGFTGKRAAEFKERFIEAFNQMEQALLEDQGDCRRVDINHRRGITNPHGLDVKYTLDLTGVIMRPTAESLAALERITGIDMSGIVAPAPCVPDGVGRWIEQECTQSPGRRLTAREAYRSFLGWWADNQGADPPSQKRFGEAMAMAGYRKDRGGPGGSIRYQGLELRSTEDPAGGE